MRRPKGGQPGRSARQTNNTGRNPAAGNSKRNAAHNATATKTTSNPPTPPAQPPPEPPDPTAQPTPTPPGDAGEAGVAGRLARGTPAFADGAAFGTGAVTGEEREGRPVPGAVLRLGRGPGRPAGTSVASGERGACAGTHEESDACAVDGLAVVTIGVGRSKVGSEAAGADAVFGLRVP
jgi:hypothetical protein